MGCFGPASESEAWRDLELTQWIFPRDLEGTIVKSLDELRKKLPRDPDLGAVVVLGRSTGFRGKDHYTVYAREAVPGKGFSFKVAYGCGACGNIIIGPPELYAAPEGGCVRNQVDYSCRACQVPLNPDINLRA
jgi:hypothetical protein